MLDRSLNYLVLGIVWVAWLDWSSDSSGDMEVAPQTSSAIDDGS